MDLDVDGALPTMVRRPPTINGTVESVSNTADIRAMPGVIDVVTIPTGVAVVAETFGQALDGKNALDVTWGPGTLDDQSSDTIRDRLRDTVPALPALSGLHLDAAFDFAFASHAPMETKTRSPTYAPTGPRSGWGRRRRSTYSRSWPRSSTYRRRR